MTLLAGFRALLARYSGQDDSAIGTPIANRDRREIDGLIGMFVNTLVLRNQVHGRDSFTALVQREKGIALAAFDYQETPFELVVDALGVVRSPSRTPLFQVMYAHAGQFGAAGGDGGFPGLTAEQFIGTTSTTLFDLMLTTWEHEGRIRMSLVYNVDLLDGALVEQIGRHYIALLDHVSLDPTGPLAKVSILSDAERRTVLGEENAKSTRSLQERSYNTLDVVSVVEAQVARAPEAVAVEYEGERVTYRELDERANQWAYMFERRGITAGSRVGIAVDRSIAMIEIVLATLKAGAICVPLDSSLPADRLRYIVNEAALTCTVHNASQESLFADAAGPANKRLVLEEVRSRAADSPKARQATRRNADELLYIIYTSGSTGKPKGVAVPHRTLVNLVDWEVSAGAKPARTLQFTTLSFDVAFQEIFLTLCTGGQLFLIDAETRRDMAAVLRVLDDQRIERLFLPFAALDALAEVAAETTKAPRALREVITAGEQLKVTPAVVAFFEATGARLENQYGPTETHVITSFVMPPTCDSWETLPPIGRPIANTRVYVLDDDLEPRPIGVVGNLYLAGDGVARGYWARPDLTAERFIPDPHSAIPSSRMYRSGDLGRIRPDGNIEFLGRSDDQVKIRGYRVELGEIEAILARHPSVREAVVTVRVSRAGDRRIVAYTICRAEEGVADFRLSVVPRLVEFLAAQLPDYMIPSAFVALEVWPLTASGKIDRRALPEPEIDLTAGATEYVAPRTPDEETLAQIWRELLDVERVGVHDDFFALGGHSLLAMRVVSRVRARLSVEVAVRSIFEAPTVEGLARETTRLRTESESAGPTLANTLHDVIAERRSDTELTRATTAQEYFWYLERADPDPAAYAVQVVFLLHGPLDCETLQRSAEASIARHSVFRSAFREVRGKLFVYASSDVPRFELEIRNAAPLPESAWSAEYDQTVSELLPRMDLISGHRICGRLTALAPERHALILVIHHAVCDAGSISALQTEIFERYRALRSGAQPDDRRPVQYSDYGEALDRFARTPDGRARREWWISNLEGAQPLMLPVDHPRAEHDARRAAAPLGITPDRMHYPYFRHELSTAARNNVARAARDAQTTPFVIFLSGLAWLFHQLSGSNDICIENTYSERAQQADLERVQGSVTAWTMMRIDTSGCHTLRDLFGKTEQVIGAAYEHGVLSDYYEVVPPSIRRAIFNYIPVGPPVRRPATDLQITRPTRPYPVWKRPWEIHLTMIDSDQGTHLFWTGIEKLFKRETVAALLDRYVDLFEHNLP